MISPEFSIRPINQSDYDQWLILWKGYNLFYDRDSLPNEITQTTWLRFFDNNEPVYALVAEQNETLLGLVHYLFHRSTTQINYNCYLQDLFTNEKARNQGVGKALISAVYEKAEEHCSKIVYWQTQETNTTARKLYDKVADKSGFIIYRKYF